MHKSLISFLNFVLRIFLTKMKYIWIKCIHTVFLLLMICSCSMELHEQDNCQPDPVQVGIYAGGVQTRTEMLQNGLSAAWSYDDKLAVWAVNNKGGYTLTNQKFEAYGLDEKRGYFTSVLSSPMPEGVYTYYCSYPAPTSVNGTVLGFHLPSEQDGKASGGADIMVATPVSHGALTALPEVEDHSSMSLEMNRMMHQFRFWVPAENDKLKGASIERIVLTFPTSVVGDVQLDVSDPSRTPTLLSGSKEIALNLSEPLSVSRQNYACAAFVPVTFSQGQSLKIKAYTADKIVEIDPVDLRAKRCLAGHSTPVMLIVKSVKDYPYKMTFKVAANNLGEEVNSIRIEAPSGCVWPEQNSNVLIYSPGHKISAGEEFVLRFEDEAQYKAFSGKNITVTYDSENAVTTQALAMPNLSGNDKANVSLTIPYLFFEDFSAIPSFSDDHDNPKVGTGSDTYKGITELSSLTSALSGWYGTRIGGQSGTSIRICCRYEHVLLAGAYYKGRVYTPALSNIKDGKDVKLSVSFKYGSDRNERDPLFGSPPDKSPLLYFGINTQDYVTNPDRSEGNIIDQVTGLIGGSGYASSAPTSLSPMVIKGEALPKSGGSYTSFAGTKSVTIDNVDNGMRLAWIVTTDNKASNTNANYWLYIDDIKVSFAK